jgi:uncharacterized protein (DUF2132 family)
MAGGNKDPLHGITLEAILEWLVEYRGWEAMAEEVNINCFKSDPTVKSSLKFLRRTQWARDKVEAYYVSENKSPWVGVNSRD